MIGDIVERDSKTKPSTDFSQDSISSTGFPQHKRRWKTSAFKQRRAATSADSASKTTREPSKGGLEAPGGQETAPQSFDELERQRIDHENRQKLDEMSPEDIARAQQEILNGMNPGLVQRLLQRANIDDEPSEPPVRSGATQQSTPAEPPQIKVEDTTKPKKTVSFENTNAASSRLKSRKKIDENYDEDVEPPQMPPDMFPITEGPKSVHFPAPPRAPDLDPSDPDFLESLHEKYFPDLPADPGKMAWMAPVPSEDSIADRESPYYPHPEISISALRFDFRGRFLSPRVSRTIPSSKGLHHHGEAPEAAGYTIAELARLARSAVPAQRCIAFQTLGRILYRLGTGEWGKTEGDPIAMGIWDAMKQGRVLDVLADAAATEGGHKGSQAFATEAIWLFEKGGWKEKFKGR